MTTHNESPLSLKGGCMVIDGPVTKEQLIARGLHPDAADELLAFAAKLAAKHRATP